MSQVGDYIHQKLNPHGLDVYRNLTHVLRIDNQGNIHIYTGNVYVYLESAEIKQNLHVSGNLDVKGDLYVEGSLKVKSDVTLVNDLTVGGNIMLHGGIIQDVGGSAPIMHASSPPTSPLSPITTSAPLDDKPHTPYFY